MVIAPIIFCTVVSGNRAYPGCQESRSRYQAIKALIYFEDRLYRSSAGDRADYWQM